MALSITLSTAVSALMASQMGVDTASHNIANVATVGYSRQGMRLAALPARVVGDGVPRPGMGVEILNVDRIRDLFIDFQYRTQSQASGRFLAQAESLRRAEMALAEPGEAGLRAALNQYFNSWRDISNMPDSGPARIAVVQAGRTLALTARHIYDSFVSLRDEANARVVQDIGEINSLTVEIADLNRQILRYSQTDENVGDLRDRRDLALDQLAGLIDIHYLEVGSGGIDVSIGGRSLVTGDRAHAIYGDANPPFNYVTLKFVADDAAVTVNDGEVRGLLDQRNTDLPTRINDLNALIGQIVTDVNTAHAAGFGLDGVDGRNFFSGADASDIAVDAALLANPNILAAAVAAAGVPGDGGNAAVISDLQYARVLSGATATYDEFYENFVSALGVATRDANARANSQDLVLAHLEQARQSTAGVNLDEEMVGLMQYQRAYEAAARLIRVADKMLDTLINRT